MFQINKTNTGIRLPNVIGRQIFEAYASLESLVMLYAIRLRTKNS
jgi:hypothetical protein